MNMLTKLIEAFLTGVGNLVMGILILVFGFIILKSLDGTIKKFLEKAIKDQTAEKFVHNFISYTLKALIIIIAITKMGVQTASLVAVIGAAGLAIGLAFQGALSNFAGGILILTQRPFNIGDYIQVAGEGGVVNNITIISTTLHTVDNKVVNIPNGTVANSNITNYSRMKTRRVDITVCASYKEDITKVKNVITDVVLGNELVLKDPAPQVFLSSLESSSVDYTVRAWVNTADYWAVHFYLLENIKLMFDKEGIEIPYNKLDVNIIK